MVYLKPKYSKFNYILILILTIFINLIILEIGLIIKGKRPSNQTDGFFEKYGNNSYRLKKNVIKENNWSAFSYLVKTNSLGCRDKNIGEKEFKYKKLLLFIGDSQTFANGVNFEKSYVGVFERHIKYKNVKVDVLNLATGGHYFSEQIQFLKDIVSKKKLRPNNLIVGMTPLFISSFNNKRSEIVVKSGYLFGKNWLFPYCKLILSNTSSAYCFFRDNIRKIQYKASWATSDLPYYFKLYSKNTKMNKDDIINNFYSYLDDFNDYCQKINMKPIYLYLPIIERFAFSELVTNANLDSADFDVLIYERIVQKYCADRDILFFNTSPILEENYNKGISLRFNIDPHYNETANRLVGKYIYTKFINNYFNE